MRRSTRTVVKLAALLATLTLLVAAGPSQPEARRSADFSADPRWDALNNRRMTGEARVTRQDFGYSPTRHAGSAKAGEIGGLITRSLTPAWYGKSIAPKTLNDKLSASGTFAVTEAGGGSNLIVGWFNDATMTGWRTANSLAFRLDGNGGKYWVLYEYATRSNFASGAGTFEGERYQETRTKPLPSDGTVHRWSMSYDPDAAKGLGQLTFVLDGQSFALPLAPGHKADGATFNRFGLFNQQTSGDAMRAFVGDLVIDGRPQPLDADPKWDGQNNRAEYRERAVRPRHDFGYSAKTNHAGGKQPGEIGGIVWRGGESAYYADGVGPLSLDDELTASGTLKLVGASSDSGVCFGWFDAASRPKGPGDKDDGPNLLGAVIEGPSRVGHYFRPAYRTAKGDGASTDKAPLLRADAKAHPFTLRYSPTAANDQGQITLTLDGQTSVLNLNPGDKAKAAKFDHFGLFNPGTGGHWVELYLDDLTYTASRQGRK